MKPRPGPRRRTFALPSRRPGVCCLMAACLGCAAVALGLSPGAAAASGSVPELAEPDAPDPYTVVQEGISVRLEVEENDATELVAVDILR